MNKHYLASLFTPESIVLYGASDRKDSVGGVVFKNLLKSGYEGRIYAMNPRYRERKHSRPWMTSKTRLTLRSLRLPPPVFPASWKPAVSTASK